MQGKATPSGVEAAAMETGKAADVKQAFDTLQSAVEDTTYEKEVKRSNAFVKFVYWVLSFMVPGLGMFSEAYFVFAIGNLKPLFQAAYPQCPAALPEGYDRSSCVCWSKTTSGTCDTQYSVSDTLTYTQVAGIIFGQLVIGFFADRIGRKWGSIMCAGIMCTFGILIVASSPNSQPNNMFIMFTIMQALFGVGVGGEYPVASTSANERAEQTKHLQNRRGETVVCVFSMQGWGNLVNTCVILALLAMFGQTGYKDKHVYGAIVDPKTNALLTNGTTATLSGYWYDPTALSAVWRLSYFLGLIPVMFMLFWRIYVLRESAVFVAKRASLRQMGSEKFTGKKNKLLLQYYWHRIAGTSLSWFVWDFAFYGNKLFQSAFINAVIGGNPTLIQTLEYILLNSSVALVGYYFAAFTIDKRWMGRVRMQAMGFAWMFVLFLPCAVAYYDLTEPGSNNIKVFQFLYFFSSFWGQFGPNATTWLLPAETVPTEMRSMCHGFAAAIGKAGALVAGVVFGLLPTCTSGLEASVMAAGGGAGCLVNSASDAAAQKAQKALIVAAENQRNFYISAACGIAGLIVTYLMVPDLTGLDLKEGDKRWLAIVNGDPASYDGLAVAPKHLSFMERVVYRYQRHYNPAKADRAPGQEKGNGSDNDNNNNEN